MHSAPSVSYPVGRSRDARRISWAIWAVGAGCAGVCSYQFDSVGWRAALLLAAVLLAGAASWSELARDLPGELRWDGQHWSLTGAVPVGAGVANVHLDFQRLLLVRLAEPGRPARWLWLERGAAPERWRDLRRAVHASPVSAPPAGASLASPDAAGAARPLPPLQ